MCMRFVGCFGIVKVEMMEDIWILIGSVNIILCVMCGNLWDIIYVLLDLYLILFYKFVIILLILVCYVELI